MDTPASLLRRHGLRAKKSWGQCFLHDPSIIDRIVENARIEPQDIVVEIGAGLGTLTVALARRAKKVLAVERDQDLVDVLHEELVKIPNVQVIAANALTFDFSFDSKRPRIVGNLPYNISSPLLFHLLNQWQLIRSATLMFQKEVAERIIADPGTKQYGIPSVLCQQYAEIAWGFVVSRHAFTPRPQVDSAVITLTMRGEPRELVDDKIFRRVVRASFGARRKMLRKALSMSFSKEIIEEALLACELDGNRRGETLSIEEYGSLARAIAAYIDIKSV